MDSSNVHSISYDSKILIIGAGVFGLSTALHLAQRGYKYINLFDQNPYDSNGYSCNEGCDAASADENKILRASYGGAKLYQDLAFKAMPKWEEWNKLLAATAAKELPPGLSQSDKLWHSCGFLRLSDDGLEESEKLTQLNFPPEIRNTQYRVSDPERRRDAEKDGIPRSKVDPFERLTKGLPTDGVLDTTAGYVLASRACAFALHLSRKAGVHTHLGPKHKLISLSYTEGRATGITTCSRHHTADLILLACGGWTPSLLPQVSDLLETTAGSVLSIRLPANRPDLWAKYSPENFPVWSWRMDSYEPHQSIGGLYGLPRTPEGVIKFGFRGVKWTNYSRTNELTGAAISYPKTDLTEVPQEAMRVCRSFCAENLPDLLDLKLQPGRLCWYTDSVDNNFLISRIPNVENLYVASGGSGHGFKFLPVLGEHIVDVIEGKHTPYTHLFAWREIPSGRRNGLEEGPDGWRTLDKQQLVGERAWRKGSAL
jgi:sarcosine oxidase/L-pipecolate oxidase